MVDFGVACPFWGSPQIGDSRLKDKSILLSNLLTARPRRRRRPAAEKSTTFTILCVQTLTTTSGSLAALRQRLHLASQPPSTSTAQQARPRRHQHQKEQEFPRLGWASVSCPGRSWTHPGLWDLANKEDSGASTTHPLVG